MITLSSLLSDLEYFKPIMDPKDEYEQWTVHDTYNYIKHRNEPGAAEHYNMFNPDETQAIVDRSINSYLAYADCGSDEWCGDF